MRYFETHYGTRWLRLSALFARLKAVLMVADTVLIAISGCFTPCTCHDVSCRTVQHYTHLYNDVSVRKTMRSDWIFVMLALFQLHFTTRWRSSSVRCYRTTASGCQFYNRIHWFYMAEQPYHECVIDECIENAVVFAVSPSKSFGGIP